MSFQAGATFVPGGEDDYYMPEVAAPQPQRIAEHTTNVQQNVASMEQQAQASRYSQQPQSQNGYHSLYSPIEAQQVRGFSGLAEVPNFTPFPPLRKPGPNIPPTDEQKEVVLEAAREAVLACNDPEQQLNWAYDALSYVEVAVQNEARVARTQAARPRTPRVEHALREDAMKVTNFLADQQHPRAQFMRGMWYEFGKFGYPSDKPESFQCYKRASERGYARAWYRMGMQFESGNDPLTAIKYYRMAADQQDAAAMYRLGMMTLLGQHGQPQDFAYGLQLIYGAASGADDNAPQGAYVLGMLQAGELAQVKIPEQFLRRDIAQGKINIERAAFLGFAKAQVRMGAAYELSELNCEFDAALSLHYNALAARQGEVEAEMAISKWFLCGQTGVFEKNEQLAFAYAQRAALDGLPTAQFAIGYFYEVGIYVHSDLKEAQEWYRKAEENGNKDAKKRIEAVSRSKTISRREHDKIALQKIHDSRTQAGTSVGMPDPSRLTLNPSPQSAPYPDTSVPPPNPNFRPNSAFGINPNLRPQSAATLPVRPKEQDAYYGRQQYSQEPDQYERRGSIPNTYLSPQQKPPPQQRLSPSASPQSRPQDGRAQQRLQTPQAGPQANLNLGFSAPQDKTGADRPNWSPHMSGSGEGPRPRPQGQSGQHPPRLASAGSPPQAGRPQQQAYPPAQRLPSGQQKPAQGQAPSNVRPANVQPTRPNPQAPPDIQQPKPPAQISANQAATQPPPKKGPATFAEMGIPQQKEEKDCIVM